jgi:hypothetical protein
VGCASRRHAANTDLARRLARHEPLRAAQAEGGAAAVSAQQQAQQQPRPSAEAQPRASHYEQPQQEQQQQMLGYQVVGAPPAAGSGPPPAAGSGGGAVSNGGPHTPQPRWSNGGGARTSTSGEVLVNGGPPGTHAYEYAAQPSAYEYAAQPNEYAEQAGSQGSALGAAKAQMDMSMQGMRRTRCAAARTSAGAGEPGASSRARAGMSPAFAMAS